MVSVMVQVLFQPQHRCNNALYVFAASLVTSIARNCETEQDCSKVLITKKRQLTLECLLWTLPVDAHFSTRADM